MLNIKIALYLRILFLFKDFIILKQSLIYMIYINTVYNYMIILGSYIKQHVIYS